MQSPILPAGTTGGAPPATQAYSILVRAACAQRGRWSSSGSLSISKETRFPPRRTGTCVSLSVPDHLAQAALRHGHEVNPIIRGPCTVLTLRKRGRMFRSWLHKAPSHRLTSYHRCQFYSSIFKYNIDAEIQTGKKNSSSIWQQRAWWRWGRHANRDKPQLSELSDERSRLISHHPASHTSSLPTPTPAGVSSTNSSCCLAAMWSWIKVVSSSSVE